MCREENGNLRLPGCFVSGAILLGQALGSVALGQAPGVMEDIRDLDLRRPPASPLPAILLTLTGILVVAGAFLALRWFLGRNRPEAVGPPPEALARHRLKLIGQRIEELPPNKASLEVSETLKDFLTARYGDPIRYETAEEYLTRITQAAHSGEGTVRLSSRLIGDVRSFMAISEELKFAQIHQARNRIPALIEQAVTIVEMAVADDERRRVKAGKR